MEVIWLRGHRWPDHWTLLHRASSCPSLLQGNSKKSPLKKHHFLLWTRVPSVCSFRTTLRPVDDHTADSTFWLEYFKQISIWTQCMLLKWPCSENHEPTGGSNIQKKFISFVIFRLVQHILTKLNQYIPSKPHWLWWLWCVCVIKSKGKTATSVIFSSQMNLFLTAGTQEEAWKLTDATAANRWRNAPLLY